MKYKEHEYGIESECDDTSFPWDNVEAHRGFDGAGGFEEDSW